MTPTTFPLRLDVGQSSLLQSPCHSNSAFLSFCHGFCQNLAKTLEVKMQNRGSESADHFQEEKGKKSAALSEGGL
jgi:hypothetical protein